MAKIERNERRDLTDFLGNTDIVHAELPGTVHGLVDYQLPNGKVAYSGVLTDEDGKQIAFRGGIGVGTAGLSLEGQTVKTATEVAALKYSQETGDDIYLGVFFTPGMDRNVEPACVSYVTVQPIPTDTRL